MEKLIIAPQIVVYKNILKNSFKIIDDMEKGVSLFSEWRPWYEQGARSDYRIDENSDKNAFREIVEALDFIKKDYFEDFQDEKGIWPDFITNWNQIKNNKDVVNLEFFKYNLKKGISNSKDGLLMNYHVDDFYVKTKNRYHVITINFYLNDDYEGGEICAYDSVSNKAYSYKPSPGDAVVMPSTEPFYHAVKSFDGGDRYFLRSFVDCEIDEKELYEYDMNNKNIVKGVEDYIKNDMQIIKVEVSENKINGLDD